MRVPAATKSALQAAAHRQQLTEQFYDNHRYAMVLHTDQGHPHVHLAARAMGEDGRRLNIYKATLQGWRRECAQHLLVRLAAHEFQDRGAS